jgi:hypothetical protein
MRQEFMDRIYNARPRTPTPGMLWPEPGDDKPRKKNKPQSKVNNFFKQKENEDGYPMKLCAFEPSENRFVYRPPGYGAGDTRNNAHCLSCHLKPCVVEEYRSETDDCFFDFQITKETPDLEAQEKTLIFLHKKYCKAIKRRYLKKLKPPPCIVDGLAEFAVYFCANMKEAASQVTEETETDQADGRGDCGCGEIAPQQHQFDYGDSDDASSMGGGSESDSDLPKDSMIREEAGEPLSTKKKGQVLNNTKKAEQTVVCEKLRKHESKRKLSEQAKQAKDQALSLVEMLLLAESDDDAELQPGIIEKLKQGSQTAANEKRKRIKQTVMSDDESDEEFEV